MLGKRYPDEFKIEAVKQVTERGYKIADVAERLGNHAITAFVNPFTSDPAMKPTWMYSWCVISTITPPPLGGVRWR